MDNIRFRVHFEAIDVIASSPEDAIKKVKDGKYGLPDVRQIYIIDENGFPIK